MNSETNEYYAMTNTFINIAVWIYKIMLALFRMKQKELLSYLILFDITYMKSVLPINFSLSRIL